MLRQDIRNLASLCVDYGVKHAVIAPGSRNAPLTIAFTSQKEIECLSVTDERSAGFLALGISQLKGEAVALICTSGSAVLNFAPAIVEAFYQNLPLIVITADRPTEWIDQSDGQTIRQQDIYHSYIKKSFQLPTDQDRTDTVYSDRQIAQALDTAISFPQGPVHLNVPLKEPLYTEIPTDKSYSKFIKTSIVKTELGSFDDYLKVWNDSSKKLIVIGSSRVDSDLNEILTKLAQREDIVVFADNLSNCVDEAFVDSPDLFIASLDEVKLQSICPDLLITVGQSVISKKLKEFLRNIKVNAHWQLNAGLPYADTYLHLSDIINMNPAEFFNVLFNNSKDAGLSKIAKMKIDARSKFEKYVDSIPFSDLTAVNSIFKHLPADYIVQISNSTPIRLSQLLASRKDLQYFCNRGTSGIEGSVSTAVGSVHRSKQETLFISGDLSFLYDSNGLWHSYLNAKLKIVVLNNSGANIFRIIGDEEKMVHCKEFFTVPHKVKIDLLCAAYGVKHHRATNQQELNEGLSLLFKESKQTMVLEVITNSTINTSTFRDLFKSIKH